MRPLADQIPPGGLPHERLLPLARALATRLVLDHALDLPRGDLHPDLVLWDGAAAVELPDPPRPRTPPDPPPELTGAAAISAAGFFAPEQSALSPPSVRADLFVAGTILYLAATGEHPFADERADQIAANIQSHDPTPPGRVRDGLPLAWDGIVMNCLHKDPRMRYASALDLERDVRALPLSAPPGTGRRMPRRLHLGRLVAALAALAALGLLLFRLLA
jgi:serine/threonine-protein kinase